MLNLSNGDNMSTALDLGRLLINPGRKLYGLVININVEKASPNLLAKIFSLPLLEYNAVTLNFSYTRTLDDEAKIAKALVFLDLTDTKNLHRGAASKAKA